VFGFLVQPGGLGLGFLDDALGLFFRFNPQLDGVLFLLANQVEGGLLGPLD